MDRIVLAYSGGLDTTVAVPWLAETRHAEVVAVTVDLGQGRELDSIRERALAAGCLRAHVLDARAEFADAYILPALQAGAMDERGGPLVTALGRPLIVSKLIEIARIEGAFAIAHGCPGTGIDQVRMDVCAHALDPSVRVIAPARDWGLTRLERIAYAKARGVPVPVMPASPHHTDANLWGRLAEDGVLDDPWVEPPANLYAMTVDPAQAPGERASVEIVFDRGVPTAINGVAMSFVDIIASLNTIAGNHGVGRIDMVHSRPDGIPSRVVYEAPAATVLHQAYAELETLVSPHALDRAKRNLAAAYVDLVDNGQWFSPLREAIDAFVGTIQAHVTGTVRVRLLKGTSAVVGRQSPRALRDRALANPDAGDRCTHTTEAA
jgi:argininosuccinate synthase